MYFPYHYSHIQSSVVSERGSWDGLIAIATLAAVVVALFGQRFWDWWRRPIVQVSFDKELERCYRWALAPREDLQDQGTFTSVRRQFFRLKVENKGLTTVRGLRAKIELYDAVKHELADRFEPNELNWISGSDAVSLAPNEEEYLNLLAQVLEPTGEADYFVTNPDGSTTTNRSNIKYKLRVEIVNHSPRGIAWDRLLQDWKLRVSFHAENLEEPTVKFFKFTPAQNNDPGVLEESLGWDI